MENDDFLTEFFMEMVIGNARRAEKYKVTFEEVQATSEFFTLVQKNLTRDEIAELYGPNSNATNELVIKYDNNMYQGQLDAWHFYERLDPINKRKLVQWSRVATQEQVRNGNDFFKGVWLYIGVMQLEDIYDNRAQEIIAMWDSARRGPCDMEAWMFYRALADSDRKLLVEWYNARMDLNAQS